MTASNKTGLSCEIHLDVEYDVTSNFLKTNEVWYFTFLCLLWREAIMSFPCNLDFSHLFVHGLSPEVCVRSFVNFLRFLNRLGQADPKLVSSFPISRL